MLLQCRFIGFGKTVCLSICLLAYFEIIRCIRLFFSRACPESSVPGRTVLVFDNTEFNLVKGYSTTSGFFTAPLKGIYSFSVTLETTGSEIDAFIVKNNENIANLYGNSDGRNGAVSRASTYVHMNEGTRRGWNGPDKVQWSSREEFILSLWEILS